MDQQDRLPEEALSENTAPSPENTEILEEKNTPKVENNAENTEKSYAFRWSYADQRAFDLKNEK